MRSCPKVNWSLSILCELYDDSSKFTWIYLLKNGSEVFQAFLNSQQYVEDCLIKKFLLCKLIRVVSTNDYIHSLKKLALIIMFLVLMLNKIARPNVSIDTSFLAQASVPLKF